MRRVESEPRLVGAGGAERSARGKLKSDLFLREKAAQVSEPWSWSPGDIPGVRARSSALPVLSILMAIVLWAVIAGAWTIVRAWLG